MELYQKDFNAGHWRTHQGICACSQICSWSTYTDISSIAFGQKFRSLDLFINFCFSHNYEVRVVTISDIVVRTEYLYSVPSCQCIKAGLDINTKAV